MDRRGSTRLADYLAARHGVASRGQLLRLGLTAAAIDSRVRRGALRARHIGVYVSGHVPLSDEARWLAAVLACGEGAVLSHTSAARLWRMSSVPADPAVHVTVPRTQRRRPGIVVHRSPLTGADVTVERGVPVTTPGRTLVDLAAIVPYAALRAIADHGVRLDVFAVRRAAARSCGRRGRVNLARLLGDDGSNLRTRSRLERRMRRLARHAGLEPPLINQRIHGHERDFAWPAQRLVVEVDGHAFHAPRGAPEHDHDRDAELVLAGWRVLRFTDAQVFGDARRVRAALAAIRT
jgi:very-short-patch-repair endonuclease